MEKATGRTVPWTWLALGLVSIAARLWLWWSTFGSNDSFIWAVHGLRVFHFGLTRTYELFPDFNHSPLMGLYARWAWSVTGQQVQGLDLDSGMAENVGHLMGFARLIKLPGLLGEGLVLWALWRFASPRAFAVYAMLPAPILVSGYHGNSDCLYAAFPQAGAEPKPEEASEPPLAAARQEPNKERKPRLAWAGLLRSSFALEGLSSQPVTAS